MRGLREAASVLTRVPVTSGGDVASAVPWFPVVGAAVGLAVAGIYTAGRTGLPPLVAATLAVSAGAWLTRGFHEDGLADTADALGSGARGAEALRILKDPALGTYGVLALVGCVLVRVGTLASFDAGAALAVLPAAHAMSRGAAGVLLLGPPSGEPGLGSSLMSTVSRGRVWAGSVTGGLVGFALLGAWFVPAAALAGVCTVLVGAGARRRFGGITGDVMGAAQQLGEAGIMVVGTLAASWGPGLPWWG